MAGGPRIGLALAGGGPLGAIYEIGALCALEEALPGLDCTRLPAYVGVSAGGVVAAGLANGLGPRAQCAAFIENRGPAEDVFHPAALMQPAWAEAWARLMGLPGLLGQGLGALLSGQASRRTLLDRIGRLLPSGLLAGEPLHRHLERAFRQPGRSNDFRDLAGRLVLVAVDLDTGEAVPFGRPGWDHVPISRAVQASAALPGLYPPVTLDGRSYVDGALRKTLHASVILEDGLDLLIALNPLVPYDGRGPRSQVAGAPARLVEGGLPTVLSQTFRTLIRSRLELGLARYARDYPHTELLLIEPDPQDAHLFFTNPLSYAQRRWLAEHAYQSTRAQLRARAGGLAPRLARLGLRLDQAALEDPGRRLVEDLSQPRREALGPALGRLNATLDRLETRLATRRAAPPDAAAGRRHAQARPRRIPAR